jgi:hypothetical protein
VGPTSTWIQEFDGATVSVISGWTTPCVDCVEECEADACDELEHLGAECVLEYTHEPQTDARVTITYDGAECEIDVVTEPAVDPN